MFDMLRILKLIRVKGHCGVNLITVQEQDNAGVGTARNTGVC